MNGKKPRSCCSNPHDRRSGEGDPRKGDASKNEEKWVTSKKQHSIFIRKSDLSKKRV